MSKNNLKEKEDTEAGVSGEDEDAQVSGTEENKEEHTPFESTGETAVPNPGEEAAAQEDSDPDPGAEVLKWKDLALRSMADLENYRKRMAREKTDAIRFANAGLLEALLPILDNFEWGLKAAEQESSSSSVFQGMSMVFKQIEDFLSAEGIETIKTEGETFDPNIHDAVAQEPSETLAEGIIISQSRKGYRLRDRLLRPAGVIVSTGTTPATGEEGGDTTGDTDTGD